MKILRFPLGQLQANCYILTQGDTCILIDPADDAAFILEELQRRRLQLTAMIATHGHFDHVMAAGEIQLSLEAVYGRRVPFYISKADTFLIKRLGETAKYFLGYEPHIIAPQHMTDLKAGTMHVGDFTCEVIATPGHTPGSCSLFFADDSIVFTGDTLFKDSIGRYDFSYSDKKELKNSLHYLMKLPAETCVYSGHGIETTIGEEKQNIERYF